MTKPISDRKIAALLVGLALGIRIVVYLGSTLFHGDGPRYLAMAEHFSDWKFQEGLGLTSDHPLYPLLITFLQPLLGSMAAGYWISIIFGSLAAAPLFFLTRDFLGRPVAFFGTLLYVFHRHIVDIQADVVTEGLFFFFLFSALWLGGKTFQSPNWRTAILAGIAAGAAFLTRAEGLIAIVGLPCWMLVSIGRGRGIVRTLLAGLLLGTALLTIFPYLDYLREKTGRWTLSAKPSVKIAFGTVLPEDSDPWKTKENESKKYLWILAEKMRRITYYVLLPLALLGLLFTRWRWDTLFYISFPVVYWLALILLAPQLAGASTRYLLPGLALLFPFCVRGMIRILSWAKRPALLPCTILIFILLWGGRSLSFKRYEDRALVAAAEWISTQKEKDALIAMSNTGRTGRFLYLAGGQHTTLPESWAEFQSWKKKGVNYIIGYEKEEGEMFPTYLPQLRNHLGKPEIFRQKIFRKENPRIVEVYRIKP